MVQHLLGHPLSFHFFSWFVTRHNSFAIQTVVVTIVTQCQSKMNLQMSSDVTNLFSKFSLQVRSQSLEFHFSNSDDSSHTLVWRKTFF